MHTTMLKILYTLHFMRYGNQQLWKSILLKSIISFGNLDKMVYINSIRTGCFLKKNLKDSSLQEYCFRSKIFDI